MRRLKVENIGDPRFGKYQIRLKGKWIKEAINSQYVTVEVREGEIIIRQLIDHCCNQSYNKNRGLH